MESSEADKKKRADLIIPLIRETLPNLDGSIHPWDYNYFLCIHIIARFLDACMANSPNKKIGDGRTWVTEFLLHPNDPNGYFRSRQSEDARDRNLHNVRVRHLADLICNIIAVPGIDVIFRRLVLDIVNIDETVHELEMIALVLASRMPLRIHPRPDQELNFDCEAAFEDGYPVYLEMKCKRDDALYDRANFKRTLRKAKTQLPKGGYNVAMIRIPAFWVEDRSTFTEIESVVANHFQNNSRLTTVVLFTQKVNRTGSLFENCGYFTRFDNERSPAHFRRNDLQFHTLMPYTNWFTLADINFANAQWCAEEIERWANS